MVRSYSFTTIPNQLEIPGTTAFMWMSILLESRGEVLSHVTNKVAPDLAGQPIFLFIFTSKSYIDARVSTYSKYCENFEVDIYFLSHESNKIREKSQADLLLRLE
jgi:hypothetical protein